MNDEIMFQTIGELKEANRNIAKSMEHIKDNLKTLNDHNVLHTEKTCSEHKGIILNLQLLTNKYWWLIVGLIATLLITVGIKESLIYFLP